MVNVPSGPLQVVTAGLRLGFNRQQSTLLFHAQPGVDQLVGLLRQSGIILHYELLVRAGRCQYRVYLHYRCSRPAIRFKFFLARGQQTHHLTYGALRLLARTHSGVHLYLKTTKGIQTLESCLRAHMGGRLFLAVYPN
jgi:hypothetical protein